MGTFNDRNFVDLSQQFDWRKGRPVPPLPKARVRLFAPWPHGYALPASQFLDTKHLKPEIKMSFSTLSKKKTPAKPAHTAKIVQLFPAATPQKRTTLRLKKKVELPPTDCIANLVSERKRHPLSNKSWGELLAEAEKPKHKKIWNIDLADAFKSELRAFEAEQKKMAAAEQDTAPKPSLKKVA